MHLEPVQFGSEFLRLFSKREARTLGKRLV